MVQVVDLLGASVPEVAVVLRRSNGDAEAAGVTAASGAARFSELVDRVEVAASGIASQTVAIGGKDRTIVNLELEESESSVDVFAAAPLSVLVVSDALPREVAARPDLVESIVSSPHFRLLRRGGTNCEPVVEGPHGTRVVTVVDGSKTSAAGPAQWIPTSAPLIR